MPEALRLTTRGRALLSEVRFVVGRGGLEPPTSVLLAVAAPTLELGCVDHFATGNPLARSMCRFVPYEPTIARRVGPVVGLVEGTGVAVRSLSAWLAVAAILRPHHVHSASYYVSASEDRADNYSGRCSQVMTLISNWHPGRSHRMH